MFLGAPNLPRACGAQRPSNLLRAGIFCIDWLLRRWYGVYQFSATEDDLLRVAVSVADVALTLSDGTHVMPGDQIIDLHIWNERVPRLGPLGPSLAWASRVRHRIERSLVALASHLESQKSFERCIALRAAPVFVSDRGSRKLARIAERCGLTRPIDARRAGLGHGMLAFGLAWACNPESLAGQQFNPMRHEFWISRKAFRERYMAGKPSVTGGGALRSPAAVSQQPTEPHASDFPPKAPIESSVR